MTEHSQSPDKQSTPWQYAFSQFGLTQAEFGRIMGFDRPKVSRALRSETGAIPDYDKKTILAKAKERDVEIDPERLIYGDLVEGASPDDGPEQPAL